MGILCSDVENVNRLQYRKKSIIAIIKGFPVFRITLGLNKVRCCTNTVENGYTNVVKFYIT